MNLRLYLNQNISTFKNFYCFLKFKLNFQPTEPKKNFVYFLVPHTRLTGGNIVIFEYANQLKKMALKPLIISLKKNNQPTWFPRQKVKITTIDKINRLPVPEILIASSWITSYYLSQLKAKKKIYFVQSIESRFFEPFSLPKLLACRSYKQPFIFLTEAQWIKKYLKNKYQQKAKYLKNGLNKSIFRKTKPFKRKKKKLTVLIEGSLRSKYKGVGQAFKVVKNLNCQVWLLSYSGQPKKDWSYDRFFSNIPYSQTAKVYSSCDLLLKMSKIEGMFAPPLEMMACGGTAIVTKVTGYKEYIKDGKNALVINIDDVSKARKYLKKLFNNPKLLKKLKKGGQQTAQKWPDWKKQAEKLRKWLLSL